MQNALSKIHVPQYDSNVYKEECTLCFKNQTSEEGVFVCLTCYNGGCLQHALAHSKKFDHQLALNIRKIAIKEEVEEDEIKSPPKKITKLAIGTEGGAELTKETKYDTQTYVKYWANDEEKVVVEGKLQVVVEGILKAEDQGKKEDNSTWEKSINLCEHSLVLQQDPNAPKVEKKEDAHCSKCDLNNNLWLCMTCGNVGCGRSNFLGTGGNNHGVEHYENTRHPVVLKMGTITAEGNASIFCYACDEDVKVENLPQLLLNFGIEVAKQVKTEKTTTELELEQNLTFNWFKSEEEGTMIYGKGFTGLINIGNSCYMNSILQTLYSIPEFYQHFERHSLNHQQNCRNRHADCWDCQVGKLTLGLLSDEYSKPPKDESSEETGIAPRMFKKLLCARSQFDNMNQQDANEFMQFLLTKFEENEKRNNNDPTQIFNFHLEDKLQCSNCRKVRYNYIKTTEVPLSMPLKLAEPKLVPPTLNEGEKESDKDRMERENKSTIPFISALDYSLSESVISDNWNCPSCHQRNHPIKKTSLATFPSYIVMPVRRFSYDWIPKKICVKMGINPDDIIDFSRYRATGKLQNEELLEEQKKQENNTPQIPQELILQVSEMGFTHNQARKALRLNGNSVEGAIEWLFNNTSDPGEDEQPPSSSSSDNNDNAFKIESGDAKYRLFGFVLHKGTSPQMGHYVAYLRKNDKWYCFDDSRVQESDAPPFHAAFLYFWKKI